MPSSRANKFIAIGAIAASMLMYEILLTRVCAMRLFFHFAFLVISNCLLGIAASGALITLFQESWRERERQLLVLFSALYLISLVVVYWALLEFTMPLGLNLSHSAHFLQFSLFNLTGAIPFFTGGLVIGMLLTFNADRVDALYGTDLLGASLGCFSMPFLLAWFGAGGVLVIAAMLAVVGLAATLMPTETRKFAIPVGVVGLALGAWLLPTIDTTYPVPMKDFIELSRNVSPETRRTPLHSKWSSNSRIDVLEVRNKNGFIFGRGSKTNGQPAIPEQRVIMQDGSAGTFIVNFSDNPRALEIIERSLYSAAVRLKREPRVFIIGAGGGNDLWAAQAAGASKIKAIELNRPILGIHQNVLPSYTRKLLEDPRVEIVIDEGRSALMQDTSLYDVIQMTGIDTWTALASGAYVLAENYLYTREAFVAMHEHLADGGIVQITRFAADMEALRMASNLEAAFEELGRDDLATSLATITTPDGLMAFLVKKSPFLPAELAQLEQFADRNGMGKSYIPGKKTGSVLEDFLTEPDKATFIADFPRNITPTTDDKPYFFNFTKWGGDSARFSNEPTMISQGNPRFILSQLALSVVLSALLILLPAFKLRGLPNRGATRFLVYFASLGLGFILLEIAILQKLVLFLGHPTYSLTVTLFSVLFFTGLGSMFLSNKFELDDKRVWIVPIGLAVLIGIVIALSPWLVANFIGLPLAVRIAIAIAILAPIALLLGIPFAYGIRILDARGSALIPWAWAINGCFSVVGSILTVVISMNFGFNFVMMVAAGVYAVGFWALRSEVSGA